MKKGQWDGICYKLLYILQILDIYYTVIKTLIGK